MDAKPREEADADARSAPPQSGVEIERYGVLELRRTRKGDGRALIVYSRPSEDR